MADTAKGNYSSITCKDCNKQGCSTSHWGPMVPKGVTGVFCNSCWPARVAHFEKTGEPAPLETKWD
jgi:hypothetical protein